MSIEISILIGVLSFAFSLFFGLSNSNRVNKKENQENGAKTAILTSDIGYIKSSVDDIKHKQEKHEKERQEQHLEVMVRLSNAEKTIGAAHHRIDAHDGRFDRLEGVVDGITEKKV